MPEARDLVLARWVIKYRKAPKVAVTEALKAVERKRSEGLDTSLAKVLVERGWLSVTDLREIVGKARGDAFYCRRCAGRFALQVEDGKAPSCPRCNVPLIEASRSPPQSARWVRPTIKADPSSISAANRRPASLRTSAAPLPWPTAPTTLPPSPTAPTPPAASPAAERGAPGGVREVSDDSYDPSSWPAAPPRAVSGRTGLVMPPPSVSSPSSTSETLTFDEAELRAARMRGAAAAPVEPSTDHADEVDFDAVDEESGVKAPRTLRVAPVPPSVQRAANEARGDGLDFDEQDDEEALDRLQKTMIVEPVSADEQRAASDDGAPGLDFDENAEEEEEPHQRTGAFAPIPADEQRAASDDALDFSDPADEDEVPPNQKTMVVAPVPVEEQLLASSSGDFEEVADEDLDAAIAQQQRWASPTVPERPDQWARQNLSALSPEEVDALSDHSEPADVSGGFADASDAYAAALEPTSETAEPDAASDAADGAVDGAVDAWWKNRAIPESEWGETADMVGGSDDARPGHDPSPSGTARLPNDPWQQLARGDAPTVELPPLGPKLDKPTRALPAARAFAADDPFQPIAPEELAAIGRVEEDDRPPTDLAAMPFPSARARDLAPPQPEYSGSSDIDRALASDDDLGRDSIDPSIDVSGRFAPEAAASSVSDQAETTEEFDDMDRLLARGPASDAVSDDVDGSAAPAVPAGFTAAGGAGQETEELRDPLTGKVIQGSGRFILELTTWDNVTEFLGVDVPSLDVAAASARHMQVVGAGGDASAASDIATAVKSRRRSAPSELERVGAATAAEAAVVGGPGRRSFGQRVKSVLTNPLLILGLLLAGAFFGFAVWRQQIEAQLGDARARAADLLKRGQREQARDELTRAIALAPNDVELRFDRAEIALELGDTALARADAEHVIGLRPESPRAHELRGRALLDAGRLQDATLALDSARAFAQQSGAPVSGALLENAALAALGVGGSDLAADLAGQALAGEPERARASAVAGWIHLERGEVQRALRVLSSIDPSQRDALGALIVRARANVRAGRPLAATADLDAVAALDPPGSVAQLIAPLRAQARIHAAHPGARLARPAAKPGDDVPFPPEAGVAPDPGPLLEQALADLATPTASDSDVGGGAAPRAPSGILRLAPVAEQIGMPVGLSAANARNVLRALAFEGLGRAREALAEILDATKVDPSDGEALALLARIRLLNDGLQPTWPGPLMLRRDPGSIDATARTLIESSVRDYGNALAKSRPPVDPGRVHVELGTTYLLLNRPDEATQSAKKAIEMSDRGDARVLAADAAIAEGSLGAAKSHARRALQLEESRAIAAKLRLARVASAERNGADADKTYSEVLSLAGDANAILAERGAARVAAGDFAGGMADLEKAVQSDPTLASAWLALGRARAAPGQDTLDRAIEAIDEACEVAPSWARPRLVKAGLLESGGRLPQALAAYDEMLKLDPDNRAALLRRALLADELDEPLIALRAINEAIAKLGNTEPLFLLRIRALARAGKSGDADTAVGELAKLDLTGRLESFGSAIVYVYQCGEDRERVPWGTVVDRLGDAEAGVAGLDPAVGGYEARALFHELRALAFEANGKAQKANEERSTAAMLRLKGRPDPGGL